MANQEPKDVSATAAPVSTSSPTTAAHDAAAHDGHVHVAHASSHGSRRWIVGGIVILLLVAAGVFGVPFVRQSLNTVSTDDAYINGHATFVAPRVLGQVSEVLVDDNFRVHVGDTLVRLDPKPYQVLVDAKRAARDVAKANQNVAEDQVRSMVAQARANRFKLQHAIETVNNQIATLRASVAALQTAQAKLTRADADYKRGLKLQSSPGALTAEDLDLRKESYRVADAQATQALEQVYQIRVGLGLPEKPEHSDDLGQVPADLDQSFSSVREALADLLQSAAPLGIIPSSYDATPKQIIEEFYKRDPQANLDRIYAKVIAEAPQIKLAQAKLLEAQSDLDQAELNLSYCTVKAEIDGVVTRRDVNPGNNVIAGQSIMAIRSLTDIWVDANFKETQLANLKIGQPVDLDVDMYGSRQVFKGRIAGFTMGTGSTLALLPAENATGNFVKVVQRLSVRIDLVDYDPGKAPLFFGLSVTPRVLIREEPTGPDAGKQLLSRSMPRSAPENEKKP